MINIKYIKIDYSNKIGLEQPYIYLLEIDDDGMVEKQIAMDENSNIISKITADKPSGDFRWEFSRFNEKEIDNNKISKQEFYKYWY